MNITHLCLNGPVTDNWNYQDNLLPKYHKKLGNNVTIITSQWIWSNKGKLKKDERNSYINENEVKMIRIKLKGLDKFDKKFKRYHNVYSYIIETQPDILFIHGCQFVDIKKIVKFAKINKNVKIFVDNHADFSNSATNWLSKNILHKIIWKKYAHMLEPYTEKFYGVTPARVDFLIDIYKLPKNKVELLVMGADDEKVKESNNNSLKKEIREKYKIESTDFLIVTGGKIDQSKVQTLLLMKAVKKINNTNIKLIVFGSIVPEIEKQIKDLVDDNIIQYIGWIKAEESYKYFAASDLVVFPGRHSVFWEQVAGQGIPMLTKFWQGTTHIDLGGNVIFLRDDSVLEIEKYILSLFSNPLKYKRMKEVAMEKGMDTFSYKKIAKRSINSIQQTEA